MDWLVVVDVIVSGSMEDSEFGGVRLNCRIQAAPSNCQARKKDEFEIVIKLAEWVPHTNN